MYYDIDPVLKSFGRLNTAIDVDEQFVSFARIVSGYYLQLMQHETVKVYFSETLFSLVWYFYFFNTVMLSL